MAQANMESPRPTALALDERLQRCTGLREPLGEVMGNPVFTCAVSGEVIPEIRAKTTKGVREELAGLNCCSAADIVLLKAGEVVNDDQHIDAEVEVLVQNSPPDA